MACSLAPFIYALTLGPNDPTLFSLIAHGEVFLIASALCADGIAEVFGTNVQRGKLWKVCLIGACTIMIFVAGASFANAHGSGAAGHETPMTHQVLLQCLRTFSITLAVVAACKITAEALP